MPRFLLDANLSPQTARFLRRQLQVDAVSILERTMEPLKDAAIAAIASQEDRVIITFDADFTRRSGQVPLGGSGVMYLRLGKEFQFVSAVNRILERFLTTQAPTIDLEHSLVTITEHAVTIQRWP